MIQIETMHWKEVLKRLLHITLFLAEHNLAFRGDNDTLYAPNNGNFLGLVEMVAKFDPVMKEHVRRIKSKETHAHHLGKDMQNEFINLLATKVRAEILSRLVSAKYYSIIIDSTPELSHQDQLSIVLRFVNVNADLRNVEIE